LISDGESISSVYLSFCLTTSEPIHLLEAADLIENFKKHWAAVGRDVEEQNKLLRRIIDRVYLFDREVIAISFKAEHHLVLTGTKKMPAIFNRGHLEVLTEASSAQWAGQRAWRDSNPRLLAP
jgi:hypothetical protein